MGTSYQNWKGKWIMNLEDGFDSPLLWGRRFLLENRLIEKTNNFNMNVMYDNDNHYYPLLSGLTAVKSNKRKICETTVLSDVPEVDQDDDPSNFEIVADPPMKHEYMPLDEATQRELCELLEIPFVQQSCRGPHEVFTEKRKPHVKSKERGDVKGDGNCWYRSVSYVICGDEDKWLVVKEKVLNFASSNREIVTNICFLGDSDKFDEFLSTHQKDNEYADDTIMDLTACMLSLPINIFSSVKGKWIMNLEDGFDSPLLWGRRFLLENRLIEKTNNFNMNVMYENDNHYYPLLSGLTAVKSNKRKICETTVLSDVPEVDQDDDPSNFEIVADPPMKHEYMPLDEATQRELCELLEIPFVQQSCRGPHEVFTEKRKPHVNSKERGDVKGDGNCWYRSVSYVICGDEDKWLVVKEKVLNFASSNREIVTNICFLGDSDKFDEFLSTHQKDNEYADDTIMDLTACMLSLPLNLYENVGKKWRICLDDSFGGVLLWGQRFLLENRLKTETCKFNMNIMHENRNHFYPLHFGLSTVDCYYPMTYECQVQICEMLQLPLNNVLQIERPKCYGKEIVNLTPIPNEQIVGDGNCWYRVIAHIICKNENYWQVVKDSVINFMRLNKAIMEPHCGEKLWFGEDWETLMKSTCTPGEYATKPVLEMTACYLNIPYNLYDSRNGKWFMLNESIAPLWNDRERMVGRLSNILDQELNQIETIPSTIPYLHVWMGHRRDPHFYFIHN
eukprot:sb/3462457/